MKQGFATSKGFKQTGALLRGQIRRASESRGFAETKLLTHWAEYVGEATAAIARPVDVSFGRGGLGATLTVLTTGANAPMLEMQKEALREKVNAAYGYTAIARIRITQTAATGFAEGQVQFEMRKNTTAEAGPVQSDPKAVELAAPVADTNLRTALERLGTNIRQKNNQG